MENQKYFELNDDQLNRVAGGTGESDWGYSQVYPNGCPKCGKDVYCLAKSLKVEFEDGFAFTDEYVCESCDYAYSKDGRYPIGYCQ